MGVYKLIGHPFVKHFIFDSRELMRSKIVKGVLCLFMILLFPFAALSQGTDGRLRVDTLSIKERISLRTNLVDWTALIPNIGIEFDVKNVNWNRWTAGLHLRGNWETSHTFKPGLVYNLMGVRAEFRNYWRTREIDDNKVQAHTRFIDKAFSCRRRNVKHPDFIYYRGLYVSYNNFSIKLIGDGYQGSAMTVGVTYGIVKPLYVFRNGSSLDLEMGISAGFSYAKYDRYRHDRESDCYPVTEQVGWSLVKHPVISDLRFGFVYRLGKYPVTKRYHWRYDCDSVYRERMDSIRTAMETERMNQQNLDSLVSIVRAEFQVQYDSILKVKKAASDSLRRVKAAQEAADVKLLKEAKLREKKEAAAAKAAEKEAAKAAKKNKKDKPAETPNEEQPTEAVTPPTESPTPTEEPKETPTSDEASTPPEEAPTEGTSPTEAPSEEAAKPEETPAEEAAKPEETPSEEAAKPEEAPSEEAAKPEEAPAAENNEQGKEAENEE